MAIVVFLSHVLVELIDVEEVIVTEATQGMALERRVVAIAVTRVLHEVLASVAFAFEWKEVEMLDAQIAVEVTMSAPDMIAKDLERFEFHVAKRTEVAQQFLRVTSDPFGFGRVVNSAIARLVDRRET